MYGYEHASSASVAEFHVNVGPSVRELDHAILVSPRALNQEPDKTLPLEVSRQDSEED